MYSQLSELRAGSHLRERQRRASALPVPRRGCTSRARLRVPSGSVEQRGRPVEPRVSHAASRDAGRRETCRKAELRASVEDLRVRRRIDAGGSRYCHCSHAMCSSIPNNNMFVTSCPPVIVTCNCGQSTCKGLYNSLASPLAARSGPCPATTTVLRQHERPEAPP